MELLGHIYVDESVDKLNGFGREVLPMLQEEYLGKIFGVFKEAGNYLLRRVEDDPKTFPYKTALAQLVAANSHDIGMLLSDARMDFKQNDIRTPPILYHSDKALEEILVSAYEESLKEAS